MGMPSSSAAEAGLYVLRHIDSLRSEAQRIARWGLAIVDAWVKCTSGVSWHPPMGPGFGCIKIPAHIDDIELAERLHDREGVLLVPGTLFEVPGTLRASWLQAGTGLEEGLKKLGRALQEALPGTGRSF
jgi:DNA-binding transcriptional MocR family regulator